ncbi:TIGR01777 family oxidoreductase [Serinibacter salmoneus]|uniref:TIGR01777 family protein n=1 Tax=Serinibacter salmoneus TaxID=556530 RepID=A0A2A9CZD7_9MICO|nr:TIGR01777 family oxidoreductase [Serinibacter salmoneus]PFG19491.1 hypothetical protein ATL40_1055 [Serinibacter salmoneus]
MTTTPQPGGPVLIAGASGLIGSHLRRHLAERGIATRVLVRRPARGADEVQWDPTAAMLPAAAFEGVSAVLVLSGVGVADRRWTRRRREAILSSRVGSVDLVARTMAEHGIAARLVTASAVGYYGEGGQNRLTESAPAGNTFLARVCQAWEGAAAPAADAGIPVAHARTGIVLTPEGGALGRLLPLLRLGLAGPLGSGRQWWPWITLEDEIRAMAHLLESEVVGPVNLTAPEPARNADLTRALARELHRPAFLPVPGFALRLAVGGFAAELLASQNVVPEVLLADGFEFTSPDIEAAAQHLL